MKHIAWLVLLAAIGGQADDQVVHFKLVNDYLIVTSCSVGKLSSLRAVIDTGSTDIVLDTRVERRLSLATTSDSAVFVTHGTAVRGAVAPSLDFGPIHTGPIQVIAGDLSGIGEQLGIRVDVVIGMNLLRHSDFVIDYKAHELRFGSVPPMHHQASFEDVAGLAVVTVSGLGAPLKLLVDTGFSQMLIFQDHVPMLNPGESAPVALVTGMGQEDLQEIDPAAVKIGDCTFIRPKLMAARSGGSLDGLFNGLLGARFLGAHRIGFQFNNKVLSWE